MPETPDQDPNPDDIAAQMDAATRRVLTTPTSYTLTGYSDVETNRGLAWSARLHRDGTEVASVSDEGNGGCLSWRWRDSAARDAFTAEAVALYGEGSEVADWYAGDLATAAELSRKRKVVFVTDAVDWARGETLEFRGNVTLAQAKAHLADPAGPLAGLNPMVWDKRQQIFVPAADIDA